MADRLGFGVRVVLFFLLFDAVKGAVEVFRLHRAGVNPFEAGAFANDYLPYLLAGLFDIVVAFELFAGARMARFWGALYLAGTALISVFAVVLEPARWVELGTLGRARQVATWALDAGMAAVLLRSPRPCAGDERPSGRPPGSGARDKGNAAEGQGCAV